MTDNVIPFRVRKAQPGSVYCAPLKVYFPKLYRITQTITKDHVLQYALDGELDPGTFYHFDLEMNRDRYIPSEACIWDEITHIQQGELDGAIAIRHHTSIDQARTYIVGAMDALCLTTDFDHDDHPMLVHFTGDGVFTIAQIPLPNGATGPTIFYLSDHMTEHPEWGFIETPWAYIVGHDGEPIEPAKFGF